MGMHIDIDDLKFESERFDVDDPKEHPPEIDKYYEKLEGNIQMLLKGVGNFVMIDASGGIGKTYNITRILDANLKQSQYVTVSGKITPLELYKKLWQTQDRGNVLFLDDASLKSDVSMELLKAATDTSEPRRVSYSSSRAPDHPWKEGEKIDTEIIYRGKIIMCANETPDDDPHFEALKSRAITYYQMDKDFDYETVISLMREIAKLPGYAADENGETLTVREQQECAEWIADLSTPEMNVNLRTLEHICHKRLYGKLYDADWLPMALDDLGYHDEDMYLVRRLSETDISPSEAEEYFLENTDKSERTFWNYWRDVT